MEQLVEPLGGLIIIGGAVLIVYFIARYTYLIKRMLAEKGMLEKRSESRISKVDVAYVTAGIGIGLMISAGISTLDLPENTLDLLAWGVVLISGAVGLVAAEKRKK